MEGLIAIAKAELMALAECSRRRYVEYQKDGLTLDAMTSLARAEAYEDAAKRLQVLGPSVPPDLKIKVPPELSLEFSSVFEDIHLSLSLLRRRVRDVENPEVVALSIWLEQIGLRAMRRMRKIMNIPF
jgi:hypothetical protein